MILNGADVTVEGTYYKHYDHMVTGSVHDYAKKFLSNKDRNNFEKFLNVGFVKNEHNGAQIAKRIKVKPQHQVNVKRAEKLQVSKQYITG